MSRPMIVLRDIIIDAVAYDRLVLGLMCYDSWFHHLDSVTSLDVIIMLVGMRYNSDDIIKQ